MVTVHDVPTLPSRVMSFYITGMKMRLGPWQNLSSIDFYLTLDPPVWRDTYTIDWNKKFFQQGEPYPFDGNAVRHLKLTGDIFPSGIAVFDGLTVSIPPSGDYVAVWVTGPMTYLFEGQTGHGKIFVACRVVNTTKGLTLVVAHCNNFASGDRQITVDAECYCPVDRSPGKYYWARKAFKCTIWDESKHDDDRVFYSDFARKFQETDFTNPSWSWNRWRTPLGAGTLVVSKYQLQRRGARILNGFWDVDWPSLLRNGESELAKTCLEGQRKLTVNMLNWVDKLTGWGGGVKAILNLGDNFNPKSVASAWLSNRFGDRLEYQSSLDVLDALWDNFLTVPIPNKYQGTTVSRAAWHGDVYNGHLDRYMRLVVSNESYSDLMTAVKGAMEWGIWPSTVNTFDLIPFSFVLDWFTNLSVILENVDDLVYKQYLKVILCEETWRYIRPAALVGDTGIATDLTEISFYERRGGSQLPEFGILEGWDPGLPSLVNIVDGASLLVQLFG